MQTTDQQVAFQSIGTVSQGVESEHQPSSGHYKAYCPGIHMFHPGLRGLRGDYGVVGRPVHGGH